MIWRFQFQNAKLGGQAGRLNERRQYEKEGGCEMDIREGKGLFRSGV
jgi:hypothetical protein